MFYSTSILHVMVYSHALEADGWLCNSYSKKKKRNSRDYSVVKVYLFPISGLFLPFLTSIFAFSPLCLGGCVGLVALATFILMRFICGNRMISDLERG